MGEALLTFKYPKAAKAHICQVCGCVIAKGKVHHFQSGVYDGSWQSWRAHSDCAEMHWHHNEGRGSDDQCDDYYLDEYRGFWPHAVCRMELAIHRTEERIKANRGAGAAGKE